MHETQTQIVSVMFAGLFKTIMEPVAAATTVAAPPLPQPQQRPQSVDTSAMLSRSHAMEISAVMDLLQKLVKQQEKSDEEDRKDEINDSDEDTMGSGDATGGEGPCVASASDLWSGSNLNGAGLSAADHIALFEKKKEAARIKLLRKKEKDRKREEEEKDGRIVRVPRETVDRTQNLVSLIASDYNIMRAALVERDDSVSRLQTQLSNAEKQQQQLKIQSDGYQALRLDFQKVQKELGGLRMRLSAQAKVEESLKTELKTVQEQKNELMNQRREADKARQFAAAEEHRAKDDLQKQLAHVRLLEGQVKELEASLQGERERSRNQVTGLEGEVSFLRGQLEGMKSQVEALKTQLQRAEREREDLSQQLQQERADRQQQGSFNEAQAALQTARQDHHSELQALRVQHEQEILQLKQSLMNQQLSESAAQSEQLSVLKKELEAATKRSETQQDEIERLRRDLQREQHAAALAAQQAAEREALLQARPVMHEASTEAQATLRGGLFEADDKLTAAVRPTSALKQGANLKPRQPQCEEPSIEQTVESFAQDYLMGFGAPMNMNASLPRVVANGTVGQTVKDCSASLSSASPRQAEVQSARAEPAPSHRAFEPHTSESTPEEPSIQPTQQTTSRKAFGRPVSTGPAVQKPLQEAAPAAPSAAQFGTGSANVVAVDSSQLHHQDAPQAAEDAQWARYEADPSCPVDTAIGKALEANGLLIHPPHPWVYRCEASAEYPPLPEGTLPYIVCDRYVGVGVCAQSGLPLVADGPNIMPLTEYALGPQEPPAGEEHPPAPAPEEATSLPAQAADGMVYYQLPSTELPVFDPEAQVYFFDGQGQLMMMAGRDAADYQQQLLSCGFDAVSVSLMLAADPTVLMQQHQQLLALQQQQQQQSYQEQPAYQDQTAYQAEAYYQQQQYFEQQQQQQQQQQSRASLHFPQEELKAPLQTKQSQASTAAASHTVSNASLQQQQQQHYYQQQGSSSRRAHPVAYY